MNFEDNFIPWDNLLIKEYTKEQMKSYAKNCMVQLLKTYPEIYMPTNSNGEINEYDSKRINDILKLKTKDDRRRKG